MAGMAPDTPIPTDIRLHKKSRMLELSYENGERYELSCEYLRVFTPSAEARGHGPGQEVLQTGKRAVDIERIEPVGTYALRFVFRTGTTAASIPGTCSTTWPCTRTSCGRNISPSSRHRESRAISTRRRKPPAAAAAANITDAMKNDTTHFGYEAVEESEKARRVADVFDSVANRYDLMNDLMSGGMHRLWKSFAIQRSGVREGSRVLDVAGGTGDLSLAFAKKVGKSGQVWLTDINNAMLARGRDRLLDKGYMIPPPSATPSICPFRTTGSTASRLPSACAT